MTILLIRHGETDLAGTFCGHADPPLNERGCEQVRLLCGELAGASIKAVYSSDLRRATATADSLAQAHGVPLHLRPDLREISFGGWEGLTWEQIEQRDPVYAQRWVDDFPRLPAPRGEALDLFERRTLAAFDGIAAKGQDAAIVAHAGVLRVLLTRRCGVSDEDAWARTKAYCSVSQYSLMEVAL